MNVFILSAGRSGSQTFARASAHITNYTSAHESRSGYLGVRAFYVHLTRNVEPVAVSWAKRSYTGE